MELQDGNGMVVARLANKFVPPSNMYCRSAEVFAIVRRDKAVYAREGVTYHWFVDADDQSLAAFELRGSQWELIDALYNDATVSLPPFESISFNLAELWPPNSIHREIPDMLNIKPASISIESVN